MAEEAPRARRKLSSLQLFGLMMALALISGGVLGVLGSVTEDSLGGPLNFIAGAFGLGVAAGLLWFCVVYWKRLDEAAREAHKFAWYWGGSLGLAVSGLTIGLLSRAGDGPAYVWPGVEATPAGYLITGALAVMSAQMVGYVLVWAGWWLWKGR